MPGARKLSVSKAADIRKASHDTNDVENSRFFVKKVSTVDPEDGGSEHQDGLSANQATYVYDTRYHKSISQITGEALPKLDNYRNLSSVHNKQRPTVDELLKGRYDTKVSTFSNIYWNKK